MMVAIRQSLAKVLKELWKVVSPDWLDPRWHATQSAEN
jgi:hypothetical protein